MVDNTEKIEKKLEEIEARLSKLESGKSTDQIITDSKHAEIAVQKEGPAFPGGSAVVLIIGGLVLLNTIPGFLSRQFFYNPYSSYGRSYLDTGTLLFILFGLFVFGFGLRGIIRWRSLKSKEGSVTKTGLSEKPGFTSKLEIKAENGPEPKEEKNKSESIEFQIASHWFGIVGVIAILVGVVFFLKFAFDNNLIGPIGQVAIGIFFGIVLLFAGEFLRGKYHKYSQILTGGGLGVLYLSLWAAFAVFHLINNFTVLGAMSLVTVAAALLAVRYDAVYIAAIGILGGFLTPVLLAKGFDNQILLLSYVIILNLGILIIAFFKNWRILNILTFAGTYLDILIWQSAYYTPDKFVLTFLFLTLIFIIFSLIWIVYNFWNEKPVEETDILLLIFNAVVYFGYSYMLMRPDYKDFLGFFAFALAFYYFLFGYLAYTKFKQDSALTLGFLGISIIFLTIAVPLQVKKNLITLIWAVEGAVLVWLGFWLSSYKLRAAALGIYILVAVRLVFFDSQIPYSEFVLLLNRRFLTYFAAAISAGVASWLYAIYKSKTQEDERLILPSLLVALNVVLVAAFTLESVSYFGSRIDSLRQSLYRTEVETRVLGQQTITKSIEGPFDDVSIACKDGSAGELLLGTDNSCSPPVRISTRLLFTNLNIPQNARIVSAYFTIVPVDNYPEAAIFALSLKNGNLGAASPVFLSSWSTGAMRAETAVLSSSMASILQSLISGGSWKSGSSLLVSLEPVSVKGSARIYSFEQDPQKAARLTVTYSTGDDGDTALPPAYNYPNRIYPSNQPRVGSPIYRDQSFQPNPKVTAEIKRLEGARDFSISAIWLIYSLILLIAGIVSKYKPIRLSALVFFAVTILKVFLIDSSNLAQGFRIIAFIGLGTILLAVAFIYQKYKQKINTFLLQ